MKVCNLQQLKNRRFHVPQPTFLFPMETSLRLSRNLLHGWKDNSVLAKLLAVCTYLFNNFRVIRCLSQCVNPKIAILPHFCFPWRRPCDYHAICCMNGKTMQCLPNPSQHVPIYLQYFRVIRCLSQCVSPKIAILPHFCFPWRRTLRLSRNVLHGWKDNSMLAKRPWGNHAKC